MTRWLVDGMNVIGSRPDGWWRDRPGAMRSLADELGELARSSGESVTVVFDGRPFELEPAGGVTIEFARRRGRDAADDDIVQLVEGDEDPGSLTVVTSDGALSERVARAGARVLGAGEFRRRLGS
ncbi:MAG TPA: NYN domain-containing protein [Thermoleophilaceae bacterium]|jgi:predicted RNA-binding protein with PIN domain|nr:NYN domain-containing protein [Thermoleophilaceae bacterium]